MQLELFGSLVDRSIERIKAFEPEEGYYLAFSGGKDSTVATDKPSVFDIEIEG